MVIEKAVWPRLLASMCGMEHNGWCNLAILGLGWTPDIRSMHNPEMMIMRRLIAALYIEHIVESKGHDFVFLTILSRFYTSLLW